MRIISFITRRDSIDRILSHIGEPTTPSPIAPARASPLWEFVLNHTLRTTSKTLIPCPSSSSTSGSVHDRVDPRGPVTAEVPTQDGPRKPPPSPCALSTTPRCVHWLIVNTHSDAK